MAVAFSGESKIVDRSEGAQRQAATVEMSEAGDHNREFAIVGPEGSRACQQAYERHGREAGAHDIKA